MGCRLSRTTSIDGDENEDGAAADAAGAASSQAAADCGTGASSKLRLLRKENNNEFALGNHRNGTVSSGNSSQARNSPSPMAIPASSLSSTAKPIADVESESQADFFRMLDEKIAHGRNLESDADD